MAIISPVEARSVKGRLLFLTIILLLSVGAITTVYPFLVMVGGSMTSEMDASDMNIIPRYLYDTDYLYRKFLETKYNQVVADMNAAHSDSTFSFAKAALPAKFEPKQAEDVRQFLEQNPFPKHWQNLGGVAGVRTVPAALRELQDQLRVMYHGDRNLAGREMRSAIGSWLSVTLVPPKWLDSQYNFVSSPLYDLYFQMLEKSDPVQRLPLSLTGQFLQTVIFPTYGETSVNAYNKAHKVPIASYGELHLSRRVPSSDEPVLRGEWLRFVHENLNPAFVVVSHDSGGKYQHYLADHYQTIQQLNLSWDTSYKDFSDIPLPDGKQWLSGIQRVDYQQFIQSVPAENLTLVGPEFVWRDWVRAQLPTHPELADVAYRIPIEQLEYAYVLQNKGSLRWHYATDNFSIVMRQLVFQGRALINTAIVCALSVLMALLINPLAAYAMSRFGQPWTYKVLLAMMATISFPPMVTMIPTFIILRHMGWLNTYWALFIPMAANGYMVFLLKGFFDSIPREIYEAAEIDGFGEIRMFFQLTLALSKPILAVVALGAFTHAYTMFLYAIIVSPAQDMWMLSVWLFQFQGSATSSAVFASILIAAIPMMIMFLLTQNVIMRGIVVPEDK